MLVLSRGVFDKVIIRAEGHEPIIVSIVEIKGRKVRLGIEAPKDVAINREEIDKLVEQGYSK